MENLQTEPAVPVETPETPASELLTLMRKTQQDVERQRKYQMIRTIFLGVCAAALTAMAVAVICFISSASAVIPAASQTLESVTVITDELKDQQITQMADNASVILQDASAAVAKLEEIDIDALNEAIANLNNTVEPMAAFFSAFR